LLEQVWKEVACHKVSLLLAENAVLAFFYEDSIKIGTLAVSTLGTRRRSRNLICFPRRQIFDRGEGFVGESPAIYNKMSIVSINTKLQKARLSPLCELFDRARLALIRTGFL